MNKEELEDYKKLSGEITEKLDNTAEYESWLIIQEYVDRLQHQLEQKQEAIDETLEIAHEYGQIDGAHHKLWVIDKMIRRLTGNKYDVFIKGYEEDGKYTWDIGIAP